MDLASLGLRVDSSGFVRADKNMARFNRTARNSEQASNRASDSFARMARRLGAIAAAALSIRALTNQFRAVIEEGEVLQRNLMRTEALISSTGRASQVTGSQMHQMARDMARATLSSTDEIMRAQQMLMSFRNIGTESFDRVTETALDLAAVTGTNVSSAMNQLARALEAPEIGLSMMRRMGVSFTESQRDMIVGLQEAGKEMEAQSAILDILQSQYGGVARAEAEGLAGAQDTLAQSFQELRQAMFESAGLSERLGGLYRRIASALDELAAQFASGQLAANVQAFAAQFQYLFRTIADGFEAISDLASMALDSMALDGSSFVNTLVSAFRNLPMNVTTVVKLMAVEWAALIDFAKAIGEGFFRAFRLPLDALVESAKLYGRALAHYLNPFSSGEFNIREELRELAAGIAADAQGIWEDAVSSVDVITQARRDSIVAIMDEHQAVISASEGMREEAKARRAAWEAEQKALRDSLASIGGGASEAEAKVKKLFGSLDDAKKQLEQFRKAADPAYAAAQEFAGSMAMLTEIFNEGLIDPDEFQRLTQHLVDMRDAGQEVANSFSGIGVAMSGISDGLGEIRNTMDSGSKSAEQLGVAMQALAVAQGIVAIVTQGTGDPYTAFARMAAMAAAIAALGVNVGSMGGGGQSTAERRQESQATGGVFGDAQAQSESILNATEITASAVSQLPALNRGMLNALQAIQIGIRGVTEGIVRGGGISGLTGDISTGREAVIGSAARFGDPLAVMGQTLITPLGQGITAGLDELWNKLNKELLRTESRAIDSGVAFTAETLGQIMESGVMEAVQFADIRERTRAFGLTVRESNDRVFQDLDDETSAALASVFIGMADAVSAGAEAIGLSGDEITRRINEFEIALGEISLQDLDPEEQQEQLNAVFSRIFDNLAESVVPFIEDLAHLYEGPAETLVRVATSVQVFEASIDRLGFAADRVDAEQFAHMAVGLIEMAGGMEEFITSMTGFFDKFASDAVKFDQAQRDMTAGLAQVNLSLPETSDGFFELMQSLDASTQSGQEQIATLLRLQDAAAEYYSQVEKLERQRQSLDIQLLELQGHSAEALAMQREMELAAMDESLHALQRRIWALQDSKRAEEEAARAAEQAARAREMATDTAMARLWESVNAEIRKLGDNLSDSLARVNSSIERRIKSAGQWLETQNRIFDARIKGTQESVRHLTQLAGALERAISATRSGDLASMTIHRQRAQRDLDAALGLARMDQTVTDFSFLDVLAQRDSGMFGSQAEDDFDRAITFRRLSELQELTGEQLSTEEKILAEQVARKEQAQVHHRNTIEALQQSRISQESRLRQTHDRQVETLQQMAQQAQDEIDVLRGIHVGVLDLGDAIDLVRDAIIRESGLMRAPAEMEQRIMLDVKEEIRGLRKDTKDLQERVIKNTGTLVSEAKRESLQRQRTA